MTSRFELWNNFHRAMTPLAHWYAIIDNQVILELQNKVIHEVLYNRYCLIKWAPMHEQVTLLGKLLSHIFKHYANVQDDSYISDKDIEEYPETFMPRLHIMPTSLQEPVPLQRPDTPQSSPRCNTELFVQCCSEVNFVEQSLNRASTISGEYCSNWNLNQKMNQCHWTTSTLRTKMCTSQMTLWIGSMNHHRTGTCAFTMNTMTDANILEHHPVWIL